MNVTKNELGQCGPINLAINATLTATCDKIVLPWVCMDYIFHKRILLFESFSRMVFGSLLS